MSAEQREKRLEAAANEIADFLPEGVAEDGRTVRACAGRALAAADRAAPVVSESYADRVVGRLAHDLERAEAAARDFALVLRRDIPTKEIRDALARHPEYASPEHRKGRPQMAEDLSQSATQIKPMDRVRHPYAGTGKVLWVKGSTAQVSWDSGGQGIAYVRDLRVIR